MQRERNSLIRRALDFDSIQALADFNRMHGQFNQQQKHTFDAITSKIETDPSNSQFFLQGPAGTGKTFVYNTLCNNYRSKNEIVLCVTSSGIAVLLLPDGQTSHSLFKIPLSIDECSTCNIRKDSDLAGLIHIESLSIVLAQCNPFARIYCHAYKILSNHESFSINSEKRSSNNGSTESRSPYIIISSSMRMHLIEGGDRRTQDLPTMEKVVTVIQIEYSDRGFRDIVLTLRSNSNLRQNTGFEQHFQRIS